MSTVSLDDKFLSVKEAADFLGYTDGRIRQLIRANALEAERAGKRTWLIFRRSAEKLARSRNSGNSAK